MDVSRTLTLLACQIDIPQMASAADRDAHLEASAARVAARLSAESGRVDMAVLPELSSVAYSRATFARLDALAEPLDGPSFRTWQRIAQQYGVYVSYGFPRAGAGGPYICNGVVGPTGALVGYYDKLHLAQYGASMEKDYFNRGKHLFVFEVNGFRLAPIICYDIRIPELARTLVVDQNADVILHSGAYYRDESFHSWHAFAVARALENQVFFLSLNRAGAAFGDSLFCPPWQDETVQPTHFENTAEDFRTITLDRSELDKARTTYTFLKDRLAGYDIDLISA